MGTEEKSISIPGFHLMMGQILNGIIDNNMTGMEGEINYRGKKYHVEISEIRGQANKGDGKSSLHSRSKSGKAAKGSTN